MDRVKQRNILKRLQGIVNDRADEDAMKVVVEVREFIRTVPDEDQASTWPEPTTADDTDERMEAEGHDRQERGGRNRKRSGES